jgi:hypothetical protein
MLSILGESTDQEWDRRSWSLALLMPNPVESYNEQSRKWEDLREAEERTIEDLDEQQTAWLKAVK